MTTANASPDVALPAPERFAFTGALGDELSARLDRPLGKPRGYALFAHCFTCSKDIAAARRIAKELARHGIAVLRFDFTGLGHSQGEFANTNFSSNVGDLVAAAQAMERQLAAPRILIGHSLGGSAVLAAAGRLPQVQGVVTIGAPADVAHVMDQFGCSLAEVRTQGRAEVSLGGRPFTITRQFVEDAESHRLVDTLHDLRKDLLVLHSPIDATVGIENAGAIFSAARHPKSFVSLDRADHLLTSAKDAAYAAKVIAAWAARFLPPAEDAQTGHAVALMAGAAAPSAGGVTLSAGGAAERSQAHAPAPGVTARETGHGAFQNNILMGRHHLLADEPVSVGGLDSGPSPYDLLAAALAACTSMTLRVYATHKGLALPEISVTVHHGKVPAAHCEDCGEAARGRSGRIDRFERVISVAGAVAPELSAKLLEIADKCPVHRTLEGTSAIVTRVAET